MQPRFKHYNVIFQKNNYSNADHEISTAYPAPPCKHPATHGRCRLRARCQREGW